MQIPGGISTGDERGSGDQQNRQADPKDAASEARCVDPLDAPAIRCVR